MSAEEVGGFLELLGLACHVLEFAGVDFFGVGVDFFGLLGLLGLLDEVVADDLLAGGFVVEDGLEVEGERADLDGVGGLDDDGSAGERAVDERAVGRVVVDEGDSGLALDDARVCARDAAVGEHDVVLPGAADADGSTREFLDLALVFGALTNDGHTDHGFRVPTWLTRGPRRRKHPW
jgi:hypothetical protein